MSERRGVGRPSPTIDRAVTHALGAVEAGVTRVENDAESYVEVASEMTMRLRRAGVKLTSEIERGRIAEALQTAGQMLMLARQVEMRLLSAVERRAAADQVAAVAATSMTRLIE